MSKVCLEKNVFFYATDFSILSNLILLANDDDGQ